MTKILDTVLCLRLQNPPFRGWMCLSLQGDWGKGRIYSDGSDQKFSQSIMSEMNCRFQKLSWNPWILTKIIAFKNIHVMFWSYTWLATCFKFNNSLQNSWKCMMIPKLLEVEMKHTDIAKNRWPRYKNILVNSFLELMVLPEDRHR